MPPVFETARLTLRRYERSDAAFLAELLGDPELMRFIGDGRVLDAAAITARLERHLADRDGRGWLVAIAKASCEPVGHFALIDQNVEGVIDAEIGWTLLRAAWGHGYAAEGAAAVRDHAFAALGLHRIVHLIAPGNARSVAVAERIGSHFERSVEFRGRTVHLYVQARK